MYHMVKKVQSSLLHHISEHATYLIGEQVVRDTDMEYRRALTSKHRLGKPHRTRAARRVIIEHSDGHEVYTRPVSHRNFQGLLVTVL